MRIPSFCPPYPFRGTSLTCLLSRPAASRRSADASATQAGSLLGLLDRVVAGLAEALPVGLIPEENHVSTVSNDVVDNPGRSCAAVPLAVDAQRVVSQVLISRLLPPVVVATLGAGHAAPPAARCDHLDPRPCALLNA